MNTFLLDLLAFGAVLSGVLVITSKNPVISVLFLISVFVNAAGYLIILGVGFIGISYLIVYVGAIAILFLFVVMMLNISVSTLTSVGAEYTKNIPLGFLVATLFTFEVMSLMPFGFGTSLLYLFNQFNSLLLGMKLSSSGINIAYTDTTSDQSFVEYLQVEAIGQGLYTYGSLWLLLSSIILLLAMLGPIVLCHVSTNKE